MRSVVARTSSVSPCGLSYFTGELLLNTNDAHLLALPRTSWFAEEALVFPSVAVATDWAGLMSVHAPNDKPFMVLPFLGTQRTLSSDQEKAV